MAHETPERAPLRVDVGDRVEVGGRDTDWPAFVFVTTARGSGWVPGRHLSGTAAGPATVVTPYDTTELPTEVGQALDVLAEDPESGWLWCRDTSGREGWVPVRTVADVD
ncbi:MULTISPECIES: SH3 domain-containing protein [Pseudofrankia]|uniref:SH3 domain-containing protein n=1 Tax=Pseudofrankia TaxID=2994363 RepID=UPI0018E9E7B6|nr:MULTISPECIES: SH3 domain-containing protein [Pseudofrankia]